MHKPETRLECLAGWCLWVTVWGPLISTYMSFQKGTSYSFFIGYRRLVFPALLIQVCLRLAQKSDPDWRKTALLVILALFNNPIHMVHFGVVWPWWIINVATLVVSFWAVAEVRDFRLRENKLK